MIATWLPISTRWRQRFQKLPATQLSRGQRKFPLTDPIVCSLRLLDSLTYPHVVPRPSTHVSFPTSSSFPGRSYSPSNNTLGNNLTTSSRHKSTSSNKAMLHMLAITASVTSLRWRPPSNDIVGGDDRHSSMMAIASVKGASAGGEGVLSLWSFHRPFMPLSVVHGHKEGAVTDFEWLQTPVNEPKTKTNATDSSKQRSRRPAVDSTSERNTNVSRVPGSSHESDVVLFDNSEGDDVVRPVEIWQHVLSVGRDGRCLIQSFVRGKFLSSGLEAIQANFF